jgi:kinesin family protein 1
VLSSRLLQGDHHVFRFNDPEAVRKQRDRATMKTHMQLSVTAGELETETRNGSPMTRPESVASSTDQADVDWTFAKREAALARLGLDPTLDNLPDEDLNKLFDKIAKVKTMRDHKSQPRPGSSLSITQTDDLWSNPFSSEATTDDTSVDAHGTPEIDGTLKDVQNQLENRLQEITDSTEAEDLKVEKDHMEHQLQLVRTQMRRLLDARARGEPDDDIVPFEPVIYSAKQLRLIRKVLDKWRGQRSFSMAETVLSNAVLLKEANVIRFVVHDNPSSNHTECLLVRSLGRMFPTTSRSLREVL